MDVPINPLQPTSTGQITVDYPASPVYFSFFLSNAASIPPSQGTVSSARITALTEGDHRMMSGLREVVVFSGGNFSCRSRSALKFQSPPGVNSDLLSL